jgi:hypothetical protein
MSIAFNQLGQILDLAGSLTIHQEAIHLGNGFVISWIRMSQRSVKYVTTFKNV